MFLSIIGHIIAILGITFCILNEHWKWIEFPTNVSIMWLCLGFMWIFILLDVLI